METFLDQSSLFTSGTDETDVVTQPEDAVGHLTEIPPKLHEDIMENPELLRPVARGMALVNLHNLFVKMKHPATPNKDRLEFQGLLNKMAGLEAKEQVASGAGVVINITRAKDDRETITIEGSAKQVTDGTPD